MAKFTKPMLAAKPDPEDLDALLPKLFEGGRQWLASPKLDGIRCSVQNGKLYSRKLKPIPNRLLQAVWSGVALEGLDGEIVVGSPTAADCFNRSTSTVMSRDKDTTGATFYVFDMPARDDLLFEERLAEAEYVVKDFNSQRVVHVKHTLVKTHAALLKYEEKMIGMGHEGIMLRDPDGAHKQGRSTLCEGGLIAVKRFVDAEAVIIDTYEQEENRNPKQVSELGTTKRSSHKANKVGKGTLGGFTVRMVETKGEGSKESSSVVFNLATGVGLTDAVRLELWQKRESLPGKLVKLRYQKIGTLIAPRIPIFLGFRDERDL